MQRRLLTPSLQYYNVTLPKLDNLPSFFMEAFCFTRLQKCYRQSPDFELLSCDMCPLITVGLCRHKLPNPTAVSTLPVKVSIGT